MNSFVINRLVKRRPELAGDIEKTHETVSLDAIASEPLPPLYTRAKAGPEGLGTPADRAN